MQPSFREPYFKLLLLKSFSTKISSRNYFIYFIFKLIYNVIQCFLYSSMNFNICMDSCNYFHNESAEQFHILASLKFPCYLFVVRPSPHSLPLEVTNLFRYHSSFREWRVNRIKQYVFS